ncbi:MAG: hypothetical protein H7A51_19335 [Akkermansiaceae bacterium]|nr:hypothetical protein [Akkermansiaceae bacterium]
MNIAIAWHGFMPYQTWSGTLRDHNLTSLNLLNVSSCGLFALHHAMVLLGQGQNFHLLRSHPKFLKLLLTGTGSDELTAIARNQGLKAKAIESWRASSIRRKVDASLRVGNPVVIRSELENHWICLGGRTDDGGYVWVDSANDPVMGTFSSWNEVMEWMTWSKKHETYIKLKHPFEIITVAPGRNMPCSRTLVPWIDSIWENLATDPVYAGDWSNLLTDMLDVFWDLSYCPKGYPAGEFLDNHIDAIISSISEHTNIPKHKLLDVAHGYRDAADFHSLVVPKEEQIACIASFTVKVATKAKRSPSSHLCRVSA